MFIGEVCSDPVLMVKVCAYCGLSEVIASHCVCYICILVLMSSIEPWLLIPCPSPLPHPQTKSAAPPPIPQQSWSSPTPAKQKGKDATMDVSPVSSDNEEEMNVRSDWGPTGMHWAVGCCIAYAPVHSAVRKWCAWILCALQSLHMHTVRGTCCVHS